jgi:PAS domain S-box-containing protein
MRVLIVDDNPADRALSRREALRVDPAAKIFEADSPDSFEAALASGPLDVAILDYSLGWTNGMKLLQRLKQRQPDTGAVLFTGSLGEEEAVEAVKSGFDDYVVKDIRRLPRLRASIESLAKRTAERRAARRTRERYRELFEHVTVGVFGCAEDGLFEDGNPALLNELGVDLDQLQQVNMLQIVQSEEVRRRWPTLGEEPLLRHETGLVRPDGKPMRVLLDIRRGQDFPVEGVMTDVTALREALDQRETLLREVYHRVYNNLAQVEALLHLQGRRFEDSEVRQAFKDVGERLRSLALVQQKLYSGQDYRHVDFGDYLRELIAGMQGLNRRPEVRVEVDAPPLVLDVERAVPLGLIANELLTNAYKHAFPDGRQGLIIVRLTAAEDLGRLSVGDDGVGMREGSPAASRGLGSQLMPNLVRQLGGAAESRSEGGLLVTVSFPL